MKKHLHAVMAVIAISLLLCACYNMRKSKGGGQTSVPAQRTINANDIALAPGYKVELVASGLSFPSGLDFDDKDNLYVTEAGYSYGEVWLEPRLIRIDSKGVATPVAVGTKNGPWTGLKYHGGNFYIAEGGHRDGGKILKINLDGKISELLTGLPSLGDHHTNGPAINGNYIYFGQGAATNSGVVGADNADFGWLPRHPDFHDIPCKDVFLTGENYTTENVLTEQKGDKSSTGAYSPFGKATSAGQMIKGQLPCTGSIMRIPLNGGPTELVAWGLRNPFGLCFSPGGALYVTDNSYDERGSRPVWGTGDVLWEIKEGMWYGWPDYAEVRALQSDVEFKAPGEKQPKPLLQKYPNTPPKPAAILGVHSSANGFDFSRSDDFGFKGQAFIALFGDMAPGAGKVLSPVGFKVVRVDVGTGVINDFAANKGRKNGPASWLKKGGLERPIAARFNPSGTALYIADFGAMQTGRDGPVPLPKTGVVWKITRIKE